MSASTSTLAIGDLVIVPGRFRSLTISRIEHGQITATFKHGGFYTGQEWEFQVTGNTPEWERRRFSKSKNWQVLGRGEILEKPNRLKLYLRPT